MSKKAETAITTDVFVAEDGTTTITFTSASGESVEVAVDTLSDEIRHQAMCHGLVQKCIDAAAIPRDPVTGKSATPEAKIAAIREVAERLVAGSWNKGRGEGGGVAKGGMLFAALCEYKPQADPEALRKWLSERSAKEKADLRKIPALATIIERLRAEKGGDGGSDAEELLAML